ncbi:hypothetical protein SLE2022_290870 [Rubroshorea leprosula]
MARTPSPTPSVATVIKAYAAPLLLLSLAILYQLVVLPRSFPPSHYDVLRVKRYSSIEEVKEAYENLSSKWDRGVEVPDTNDFIKIQYAYELLTNPLWKRDYDLFGIDEQLHIMHRVREQYAVERFSNVKLPLLHADVSDPGIEAFNVITSKDFQSVFQNSNPWLLQVYSSGSQQCAQFFHSWKRIAALLNGLANNGMVELGEVQLAAYLAEKKPTGRLFFRNGLPSLVALPSGCKTSDCLVRFEGELSVDAVIDWFATTVLNLPRIFYYSKESLGPRFLARSGSHKVKVIFFSKTGERATPIMRQAAKDYWNYISLASVLWREEEFSIWWNTFGVESAPAIVFLKDPGVKPVVYHGLFDNSWFLNVLEQNKQQELPQLRSLSSKELGCDARGYSRAGNDIMIWYCAVLAGRKSLELDKMRETMRRVQDLLSKSDDSHATNGDLYSETVAIALRKKRLTFVWLDGETQKNYCFFYLNTETGYETCGPRRVPTDVPKLFIVRYQRNTTKDNMKVEKKPKNIWDFQLEDIDPVSQLSVTYNGSAETSELIKWISNIIEDGDSRNLPFYRVKSPELVPEDAEPIWSRGQQGILSRTIGMKQKTLGIISQINDYLGDPRIGPALFLGALMSFGGIWLMRNQPKRPLRSSQPSQANKEDKSRPRARNPARNVSGRNLPPSITDLEPEDAYQMPLSDSDSDS